MAYYAVGSPVMVNMGGFSQGGISMGAGAYVSGTVIAASPGTYTVRLNAVIGGLDTVKVGPDRLSPA